MMEEFIKTKLASKLWRLNNLYHIRDKNGALIRMRLNASQLYTLQNFRHNKKIVLKSRQQGITTVAVAKNLDSCIFRPGYSAGIQSYGLDESKKLQQKAKLMWAEFDPSIKNLLKIELVVDNQHGMMFSNGSVLKIGNFRGDTLQSLHVSELAKISRLYPEKARELKTGAFQAIGKDSQITIESTAEGKSGLFYEMWQKAVMKQDVLQRTGGNLSPFDFQPIFLSWMMDADCQLDMKVPIPPEIKEYFAELTRSGAEITDKQKWWYAAKYEEIGSDIRQEYPSTPEEAFDKPLQGTYYQHEYKKLQLVDYTYEPGLLVHSACDLGMNDTFSIGFFQLYPDGQVYLIYEYMDSGRSLEYYRDIYDALAKKFGWRHGCMYVPHDITVRELTTAKTRLQVLKELKFSPIVVKRHKLIDGIEATRQFLGSVKINKECEGIISAIQNYRKAYNDQFGVFLDKPVHDEFSHTADMLRYMAMGLRHRSPQNIYVQPEVYRRAMTSRNLGLDL